MKIKTKAAPKTVAAKRPCVRKAAAPKTAEKSHQTPSITNLYS